MIYIVMVVCFICYWVIVIGYLFLVISFVCVVFLFWMLLVVGIVVCYVGVCLVLRNMDVLDLLVCVVVGVF